MAEYDPKLREILQIIREQVAFLKTDKGFTNPIPQCFEMPLGALLTE
ncbi:MAG TPA: hypothetical protein VKB76_01575 [Ktedonobacterales bacterium]|nr:hypothetical protein [Ktedonobacterales bacterium]